MLIRARSLGAVQAAVERLPLWHRIALALLALASLNLLGAFVTILVEPPGPTRFVAGCSTLVLLSVWIWHSWATRRSQGRFVPLEAALLGIYLLTGPSNGFDLSVMYPLLIVRSYQDRSTRGAAVRAPLYAVAFALANIVLGRTGTSELMFLLIHAVGLMIIAAIFRRVSQWVESDERTAQLQGESIRALERNAELKDAFLTAVSHELRTPLTMVRGGSELLKLRQTEMDDDQRGLILDRIAANADRLEQLLADLLDIDRLTRGVIQPERRLVDLPSVVAAAVESAELGGSVRVTSSEPFALRLDVGMTQRIVENLVVNAWKYSPPGAPVDVTVTETETHGLLIVADRGAGVPDADKDQIFQPFHRLDHTDPQPGIGLGLALVRRFARLQGGDVSVADREGGGSVFTVTFPKRHTATIDGEPRAS
ncbi:MAG: HAMP domain-containing histidine kinase [Actinobacteria bacterium]|nr:HAMP domain-containing histidine kinase [Actinomycetota bacterium]